VIARAALFWFAGLAGLLSVAGCSHYRLGTDAPVPFTTLHVEVVKNDTLLPQVVALVSTELRETFIKDGRVRLVDSADTADAVLSVTLVDYTRAVAVSRADDTGLGRRFDLTLSARATLHDNRTKQTLFHDRVLSAKRGAFTDSGQLQAEYQTMPLLAAQLAEAARKAVLERW
jgi:hypothetical protein